MSGLISFGNDGLGDLEQLGGLDAGTGPNMPDPTSIQQMLLAQERIGRMTTMVNYKSGMISLVKTTIGGIIDKMSR